MSVEYEDEKLTKTGEPLEDDEPGHNLSARDRGRLRCRVQH
jgi:hypothetical protein